METLMNHIQPFFGWLVQTTLIASVVICLILLIQKTLGGRLGPRWSHALWLVLLVRMVLPWAPSSRFSLFNLIPSWDRQTQSHQSPGFVEAQEASSSAQTAGSAEAMPDMEQETVSAARAPAAPKPVAVTQSETRPGSWLASIRQALPVLWLAGAIVIGIYLIASDLALWRIVKRDRPLVNQSMLELFEECKAQMGIQSLVAVVPSERVRSPGLFGFVRPRLLLPRQMLDTATRQEMRYIFLHELAHLKRHDIYLGWLASILQVLHWFNPLVWFAFYRMRADRELACDALVLARAGQDKSQEYGGTILGLVQRFSRCRPLPAMAGVIESKSQLKRRIAMITQFKHNSYRVSPLAIAIMIMMGCASVPGPEQGSRSQLSTSDHQSGMTLTRLKEQWGGFANISPDGKYLCDVNDNDEGNLDVCEFATGRRWRVTENGPGEYISHYALESAISPNGTKVAYLWYEEKTASSSLWLVDLDGSNRRLLCKGQYIMPKDWSADGGRILAALYGEPHQMVWVSAADGSIQKIKDVGKEYPGKFDVSPDGRFIAYDVPQASDTTNRDVYLYDIAENRDIHLVESPADDVLLGWTPDGKSVFFSSDRTGTWDGWLLDVRDGKPAGIPQRIKPALGEVEPIGFRSNGDYYFAVYGIRRSVYTASFEPKTCSISLPPNAVRQTGSQSAPEWSPDGKYLAYFDIEKKNTPPVICIRSVATGQEREIEPNLPLAGDLHWAPDGRSLLVTGSADKNRSHLMVYQIDAQRSGHTELFHSQNKDKELWEAQWLPDGKRFLYCLRPSADDTAVPRVISLMVRDVETGDEKELVHVELPDVLGSWALSPDGRQIAFKRYGRTGGVNLVSVDSGQTRELLGRDWAEKVRIVACWSRDGSYVFLLVCPDLKARPPITELWRLPVQGGQPEKLQTFSKLPLIGMQIHPDGSQVALCTHEGLYELWAMENFLPQEAGK